MDNALAKTKQAVSRYKSRSQSDSLNATKSVWAAVRFLRKQLPDLERKDKGVTTRVARELTDVLGKLPMFRHIKDDKEATENLSSKPQAEEHILKLENQLKAMVKDLENSKIDEIKGWVENHAVLGTLTKTLTRKMPDSTYVFLFRQLKNSNIELVTSRAPDGRVFTRFRPREFFDVKKLYRLYNHRPPVGAAVVVDNKLQDVIGTVPQAKENEDQLHVISSMSKEAASQPAKSFLSSNRVLQSLHDLAKDRKVDKGAYILLFVDAEEQIDFDADEEELLASADLGGDESVADASPDDEAAGEEASAGSAESLDQVPAAPAENVSASESAAVSETASEVSAGEPANQQTPAQTLESEPASAEVPIENPVPAEAAVESTVSEPVSIDAPVETPASEPDSKESPAENAEATAIESAPATEQQSVESPVEIAIEDSEADAANDEATGELPAVTTAISEAFVSSEPSSEQLTSSESAGGSISESAGVDGGTSELSAARRSDLGDIGVVSNAGPVLEDSSPTDITGDASSEQSPETDQQMEHSTAEQGSAEQSREHIRLEQTGGESANAEQADSESAHAGQVIAETEAEQVYTPVEILTRPGSDGGVLTRFYANEFSDVRKVFESFAGKRTIAGAAVIRGRELIQVVGNVPQPAEGKSQLDLLILESNHAADKPTRDFLEQNEILNSLHELASGHFQDPNAKVLLFTEEEGRLSVLTPPPSPQREERGRDNKARGDRRDGPGGARGRDDRGRNGRGNDDRGRGRDDDRGREHSGPAKSSPLADFRYPRDIRNGYRNLTRVVGASVIGEQKSSAPVRKEVKKDDRGGGGGGRDQRFNDRTPRASKSVVLAAFGRTPLKENVLITEETMRRLGLDFFS